IVRLQRLANLLGIPRHPNKLTTLRVAHHQVADGLRHYPTAFQLSVPGFGSPSGERVPEPLLRPACSSSSAPRVVPGLLLTALAVRHMTLKEVSRPDSGGPGPGFPIRDKIRDTLNQAYAETTLHIISSPAE